MSEKDTNVAVGSMDLLPRAEQENPFSLDSTIFDFDEIAKRARVTWIGDIRKDAPEVVQVINFHADQPLSVNRLINARCGLPAVTSMHQSEPAADKLKNIVSDLIKRLDMAMVSASGSYTNFIAAHKARLWLLKLTIPKVKMETIEDIVDLVFYDQGPGDSQEIALVLDKVREVVCQTRRAAERTEDVEPFMRMDVKRANKWIVYPRGSIEHLYAAFFFWKRRILLSFWKPESQRYETVWNVEWFLAHKAQRIVHRQWLELTR